MGTVSEETLPKRSFVESFRIVTWQFLVYQDDLEKISPFYDECPSVCYKFPRRDKKDEDIFCQGCEVGIAKKTFEEETESHLNDRLGKDWKQYGFENLVRQVKDAFEMKESGENLSVVGQIMVNIVHSELNRQSRIERFNRKKKDED